ncbi:MAG: orotidine-5'-phosphate decarboxylase [Hyphomicrobiales bacterium]
MGSDFAAALPPANPICVALDTVDEGRAVSLARALAGKVGFVKIGLEFFCSHGRLGYEHVAKIGIPVFLDLKVHDIPNTAAGAMRAIMALDPLPSIITLHAMGGGAMLRAAREAVSEIAGIPRPMLIAVTVLTSLDNTDLDRLGFRTREAESQALRLALLARDCGFDGVVCAPSDLTALRRAIAEPFIAVAPGIRPNGGDCSDQKRIATPAAALGNGADILVIGRPVTQSPDPAAAVCVILRDVEKAGKAVPRHETLIDKKRFSAGPGLKT